MVVTIEPTLANALKEEAQRQGIAPEVLALNVLRARFLANPEPLEPRDDWERRLLGLARNCGISLSNEALSRDALYD